MAGFGTGDLETTPTDRRRTWLSRDQDQCGPAVAVLGGDRPALRGRCPPRLPPAPPGDRDPVRVQRGPIAMRMKCRRRKFEEARAEGFSTQPRNKPQIARRILINKGFGQVRVIAV